MATHPLELKLQLLQLFLEASLNLNKFVRAFTLGKQLFLDTLRILGRNLQGLLELGNS